MDVELKYPQSESKITKTIFYLPNLKFNGVLKNKNIKINDKIFILNGRNEKKGISFLKKVIRSERDLSISLNGVYLLYKHDQNGSIKKYWEAQDAVNNFLTAIRIYKSSGCDIYTYFPIEDSSEAKYYKPFVFKDYINKYIISSRGETSIDNRKELNIIKKLNKKLIESKSFASVDSDYSRMSNSIQFFDQFYAQPWTLMRLTLGFTVLESLFSDTTTDISFKIALRAAFLLSSKDIKEREYIFHFIKRGYQIRSAFLHGNNSQKKIKDIMSQIAREKKLNHYSFSSDFINDFNKIITNCLMKVLLNDEYFSFFTNQSSVREEAFYTNLILSTG